MSNSQQKHMVTDKISKQLRELYRSNLTLRQVLGTIGEMGNPMYKLDIYRIKLRLAHGGISVDLTDLDDLFHKLQSIGLGKHKPASHPKHSLFTWAFPPLQVIQMVKGAAPSTDNGHHGGVSPASRPTAANQNRVVVFCPIRKGETIQFELPGDFAGEDVETIQQFLLSVAERVRTRLNSST